MRQDWLLLPANTKSGLRSTIRPRSERSRRCKSELEETKMMSQTSTDQLQQAERAAATLRSRLKAVESKAAEAARES
eukprot:6189779-Pleurochrysis_carterae.AAC.2